MLVKGAPESSDSFHGVLFTILAQRNGNIYIFFFLPFRPFDTYPGNNFMDIFIIHFKQIFFTFIPPVMLLYSTLATCTQISIFVSCCFAQHWNGKVSMQRVLSVLLQYEALGAVTVTDFKIPSDYNTVHVTIFLFTKTNISKWQHFFFSVSENFCHYFSQ